MGTCTGARCPTKGGRAQPHIPASAASVSWRSRATPRKSAPQNFRVSVSRDSWSGGISRKKMWRCVMSPEPKKVSAEISEESLGSLRGCLVEGNPEQLRRERRLRRRALAISILLQSTVLATVILVPLLSKAERIALTIVTPIPPYSAYRDVAHHSAPSHPHQRTNVCRFCQPLSIPHTIVTHEDPSRETEETPIEGIGENIPGATNELIPLSDPRQRGPVNPQIETRANQPRVLHITHLDPAMLQHRVEPVYPDSSGTDPSRRPRGIARYHRYRRQHSIGASGFG